MTDLWKTHSGSSRNRQFRTHILVTDKSNNWKTDTSTENKRIYHYNGNATAVLGIGTNKPNYRLSFGDSAKESRLTNLNNALFCLNEKQDGSNATGIGFFELYENQTAPYGNRFYTGIKFMVNNNNQYNLNDDRSIKMLLRDDGTLIVGHLINNVSTEAFNEASLDVSGNIKTSKFLILNKVTDNNQYIPRGALRYDGSELIYRNDAGLDVRLVTKFSAQVAGGWDVYEFGGAVGGIYKYSTPIALIYSQEPTGNNAAAWNNSFQNNSFAVEGSGCFGDQGYLTNPEGLKRLGFDQPNVNQVEYNVGILSVQHQLGIGTRRPIAALDISSSNMGYLKIGKNSDVSLNGICVGDFSTVQGNNSMSVGDSNAIYTSYGFVFGENNNTFELSTEYNFIFGKNNDISSNFSYVFGNDNDINSSDKRQHLIFGENNKLYDSSSVFIYGDNNRIGELGQGISKSAQNSRIFGSNNTIFNNTVDSTIVGSNNNIDNGNDNLLFGSNNNLVGGNNNLYFGQDISMNNSTYSVGIGKDISMSNVNFSVGIGKDISMNGCDYSVALGYRAELSSNLVFAVGSKVLYDLNKNPNALEVYKDGSVVFETITASNITTKYPAQDIDIFTNSTATVNIGNADTSFNLIGGFGDMKIGNIISTIDEDRNIFTNCSKTITIGNADTSFNLLGGLGDISCADIMSTIDEDRNIFTNCSKTITIGTGDATISVPGSFQNLSDIRVKDNVKTINNALEKVSNLRGVEYTRKDVENKEKKHLGLIAQEVSEILPEVVSKDNNDLLNISYINIIGVLVESIKELKEKVEMLENNMGVEV